MVLVLLTEENLEEVMKDLVSVYEFQRLILNVECFEDFFLENGSET